MKKLTGKIANLGKYAHSPKGVKTVTAKTSKSKIDKVSKQMKGH